MLCAARRTEKLRGTIIMKRIFVFVAVALLTALVASSFIFAKKNTPDEAVRRYWQYLLDKDCKQIDEMQTHFTGYRRDEKGQIYQAKLTAKVNGKEQDSNISRCYVADEIQMFGSKYFKIVKSEVDEELRTADIIILTRDKNKTERKYKFYVSKDPKDDVWKIIGFNMLVDEEENSFICLQFAEKLKSACKNERR